MNWKRKEFLIIMAIALSTLMLGVAPLTLSVFRWDEPVVGAVTRGDVFDALQVIAAAVDTSAVILLMWTIRRKKK